MPLAVGPARTMSGGSAVYQSRHQPRVKTLCDAGAEDGEGDGGEGEQQKAADLAAAFELLGESAVQDLGVRWLRLHRPGLGRATSLRMTVVG